MKAFRSLKNDFWQNRWQFFIGLCALLIVDILQLFIPRVVKHAIDDLTAGGISSSHLMAYAGAILALAFGIGGFRYVWRYLPLGGVPTNRKVPAGSVLPASTDPLLLLLCPHKGRRPDGPCHQ